MVFRVALFVAMVQVSICIGPRCVDNCNERPDIDYQSCKGCSVYATCSNGYLYDERPCPADLIWDDVKKRCERESRTCPVEVRDRCVTSCENMPDGFYQSCTGCRYFVSCKDTKILYTNDCYSYSNYFVWDDVEKRCKPESDTCDLQTSGGWGIFLG